jgi:aspartate/methionine/tyrosine aminotransferase
MFSSRFHWDLRPNRLTQTLSARRAAGLPVLDLTQSNPTAAGFYYPPETPSALAHLSVLEYKPTPSGLPSAREAVSGYYRKLGHDVPPGRILLTASTSEGYAYLFKLLTNPGDEVLVPRPSYPLFEFLATMESVRVRQYPLTYHGSWSIDLPALESAITDRTRAIVLVNPNNPTGSYVKRGELDELVRICSARNLALISDEVFADYSFSPDSDRAVTLADVTGCLAFSMSGLSKVAGLPQMKLGWIVAAGPDSVRAQAMERLEWIADTYLSVSTPVQIAAPTLLDLGQDVQEAIRKRTASHLGLVRQTFANSPATVLNVEGGWYVTIQPPRIRPEEDWTIELLERAGVLVQPGYFYDFESETFLILSLLTEPGIFREGIAKLRAIL